MYTDIGTLHGATRSIAADVSELFNYLTGIFESDRLPRAVDRARRTAPPVRKAVAREIGHARRGRPAHVIIKCNAITDPSVVRLLYRASQAGVKIDLIIRGVCVLRPGVPGVSENITVRSIVGRFLEHSRIWYFENDGKPEVYIGSADLMERNLNKRVEAVCPVRDTELAQFLRHVVLEAYLRDNVRARILQPDGAYAPVTQRRRAVRCAATS